MIKAYVLASGTGSRLRPLTERLPKPMIPFLNRPLVSHLLNHLWPHVSHIRLNVAYNKQPLIDYLQTQSNVSWFDEGTEPIGSAATLGLEHKYCADDLVLVTCGDLVCNWDVRRMLQFHREKKALVTIATRFVDEPQRFGVVVTDSDWQVLQFHEKPKRPPSRLINCGIYLFSPRVFDYWQPGWKDIGSDVFPALVARGLPVYAWPMSETTYWNDIGTLPSYLQSHLDLVATTNTIDRSACIERSVRLSGTFVGAGATVCRGSELKNCIVWPGAVVGPAVRLQESIVTPHHILEVNASCLPT